MSARFIKIWWLCWIMLLIAFPAQATDNDGLLKIHAALLPKTVLMDYHFDRKLVDDAIVVGIVCEERGRFAAERLEKYILAKYPDGIKGYPVKVKQICYDKLSDSASGATIFYLMPASETAVCAALELLQDERLIFSSEPSDLRLGAVISITVRQKVRPVINLDALRQRNISLRPVIMKISKMYYQGQ